MVYFITDGFATKIGKADDVSQRLKTLQTANSRILKVALVFEGGLDDETGFQKIFFGKQTRALNEWYDMSPEEMIPRLIDKYGMHKVIKAIELSKNNKSNYDFPKDLIGAKDQSKLNQAIIKKYVHNILQNESKKNSLIKAGKIFKNLDGITLSEVNKVLRFKDLNSKVTSHNQLIRNRKK